MIGILSMQPNTWMKEHPKEESHTERISTRIPKSLSFHIQSFWGHGQRFQGNSKPTDGLLSALRTIKNFTCWPVSMGKRTHWLLVSVPREKKGSAYEQWTWIATDHVLVVVVVVPRPRKTYLCQSMCPCPCTLHGCCMTPYLSCTI